MDNATDFFNQVGSDQDVDQVLKTLSTLKPGERIVFENSLHVVATDKGFLFIGPDDGDWAKKTVPELQTMVTAYLETGQKPETLTQVDTIAPIRDLISRALAAADE